MLVAPDMQWGLPGGVHCCFNHLFGIQFPCPSDEEGRTIKKKEQEMLDLHGKFEEGSERAEIEY